MFVSFSFLEGLTDVILYHQPDDKKKNRGFCFLEYEDHKTAAQARRRLMSGKVKVWGNVVTVEWADPIEDPDPEVMAKVRTWSTECKTRSFSWSFMRLLLSRLIGPWSPTLLPDVRCSEVLVLCWLDSHFKIVFLATVLWFSTDRNAYLGSNLGSDLISRDLTLSSHLLLGESVVCQKPGKQRHRGNTWKSIRPVWQTGASKETERLCLHSLWRKGWSGQGESAFEQHLICLESVFNGHYSGVDNVDVCRRWQKWTAKI